MKDHTLILLGQSSDGVRVAAERLVEVLDALIEGTRRTLRFVVDGESVRSGPYPSISKDATHIDVTGIGAGSTVVALQAAIGHPSPGWLWGPDPWLLPPGAPDDEANCSAIDLFGHVLAHAVVGDLDRLDADRALLDACARFARAGGEAGIELGGLWGERRSLTVRASDAETIERLRDATPAPRGVRVTGTLDTVSATSAMIVLRLSDDNTVRARLDKPSAEYLRQLFNTQVVISGQAHFGPSGRLLFVAADHIAPARDTDALWDRLPVAQPGYFATVVLPVVQSGETGVSAFFGTWPGDESDTDLLGALEAIE